MNLSPRFLVRATALLFARLPRLDALRLTRVGPAPHRPRRDALPSPDVGWLAALPCHLFPLSALIAT